MKRNFYLTAALLIGFTTGSNAQFGKLKGLVGKKDTTQSLTSDTSSEKKKGGAGFFSKAVTKLATASGGLMMKATGMISSTSNLSEVNPMITLNSNLYPAELGTVTQTFLKGWQSGGDLVTILFSKKNSFGFYKIDGSVTIDGKPATYSNLGTYSAFTANNGQAKKVEILTSTGQKSSFSLVPYENPFKIATINGQQGNVSLDLTKDVVVEFEKAPVTVSNLLRVSLAINQLSIKSFYDLPYVRSGKTITIPAAAFRNINILPGGKALYGFKNSYLSIAGEKVALSQNTTGTIPAINYEVSYSDGRMVNVLREPVLNAGITAKGSEKFEAGEVEYYFFKPNAFLSRPFNQLEKIGVSSFAIRGTTYTESKEHSTSSSFSVGGTTYTSTTTSKTIARFPQLPNSVWDAALASLYNDFVAALASELSANVLPLESVTGTEAYKSISPFAKDDENTSVEFSRAYKDSKVLSAFMPVSEGYGINNANGRIMNESGVNALAKFTFDLQIAIEKGVPVMVPKLAFELGGATHGNSTETKYVTASLIGKGQRYPKANITAADIEKIVRKSDLLAVFKKGLEEIKEKEAQNADYQLVWNLQK